MTTMMGQDQSELCGKCEVEIDRDRVIDFTLKNGKRVCEQCFVRETPRPTLIRTSSGLPSMIKAMFRGWAGLAAVVVLGGFVWLWLAFRGDLDSGSYVMVQSEGVSPN